MIVRHTVWTLITTFVTDIVFLTTIAIDTAPNEQINIKISFAKDCIGFHLSVVTRSGLKLQTIHISTLLGDNIHNSRQSHTAIERRGRTT